MTSNLYLTQEELTLFEQLPDDIQETWQVNIVEETGEAYESFEELQRRRSEVNFDQHPAAKKLAKDISDALAAEKDPTRIPLEGFPEDAIPDLLYSAGASGICVFIAMGLQHPDIDSEKMEGLAALSRIRHSILEHNAVVFS